MAWSDFTAGLFTSGQILTAAQMNTYVRDNLVAGGPIYATEAARNTAITSPFEGQRAYITGSTVAAATGTTTAVPTGIQTIYNGSTWVCVTPVGANSATLATTTSTSYVTTLTSDSTAITATLSTGTSALVTFQAITYSSSVPTNYLSFDVSGATTLAASDNNGSSIALYATNATSTIGRSWIVTGLTAGTNTFRLNYKTTTGTASYATRSLVVQGIA
jgi:hypothetical protein